MAVCFFANSPQQSVDQGPMTSSEAILHKGVDTHVRLYKLTGISNILYKMPATSKHHTTHRYSTTRCHNNIPLAHKGATLNVLKTAVWSRSLSLFIYLHRISLLMHAHERNVLAVRLHGSNMAITLKYTTS